MIFSRWFPLIFLIFLIMAVEKVKDRWK